MKKNILTKNQLRFLESASKDDFLKKSFYLTGGTALAGFYLHHRLSEDLDFFSEKEFDVAYINIFLKKNKKFLGVVSVDFQQSFNRNLFFLKLKNETLKTEFTYFPFPRISDSEEKLGVPIDSIIDIAVNKLFTIYQRNAARDYIDLYCIVKKYHWSIDELIKKAKIKFDWHIDPLQLGTQFVKAQTVSDFPVMVQKISAEEWRSFFTKEAEKLKSKVIK